jgi:hypothetical protein
MEDDIFAADSSPFRVTLHQELLQRLATVADAKCETLQQKHKNVATDRF